MANKIFDYERVEKPPLDDTIQLTVSIVAHRLLSKKNSVEYVMEVHRGPAASEEDSWEVNYRYNDFSKLAIALQLSGILLSLPPKRRSTDPNFISEQQQGLNIFLSTILSEPLLAMCLDMKRFLDPSNYSENFYEKALWNVMVFLHSNPSWQMVEPLKDIGWRIRKQYHIIGSDTFPNHLLSWCESGPDFSLSEKEVTASLKVLTELRHPFILTPILAQFTGKEFIVIREFIESGSLKDAIYGKAPKTNFLVKYGQSSTTRNLSLANIRQYGRQILEAVNFLYEKGFVMGHIHAGNVMLCEGGCKLVDTENSLMGVPSLYRQYLVQIRSHIDETVYSFGHMLYEMCEGSPLKNATIDDHCPDSFPSDLAQIIESILTPKAIKEGLPSISDLLSNPFFCDEGLGIPGEVKPHLLIPNSIKEVLKAHLEIAKFRLLNDQKKRHSKDSEILTVRQTRKKKIRKIKKLPSKEDKESKTDFEIYAQVIKERDNLKNELDFLEGKNRHLRTQNQSLVEKVSKLIREKQALERRIGLTASEKYEFEEFLQEATKEFSLEKDKLVTDNDRLYGMVLSESQMVEKFEEQADSFETCYLRERMKVQHLEEQLQKVLNEQDGRKKDGQIWMQESTEPKQELSRYVLPSIEPVHDNPFSSSGAYGSVSLVRVNGVKCIQKRLHDILTGYGSHAPVSEQEKQSIIEKFNNECILLSRMHHPNIVQFMGVHYDHHKRLSLIMEFLPMSLEDCLKRCNKEYFIIPLSTKLCILRDVSYGLLHLHTNGVVHRDLSASNILLTSDLQAKIADLGVSKILNPMIDLIKLTQAPGAPYIMPPEATSSNPQYTESIDIFAFGVLSLYLLLQDFPESSNEGITCDHVSNKEIEIGKRSKYVQRVTEFCRPMKHVITACLQDVPERRPKTSDLMRDLEVLSEKNPKKYKDQIQMLQTINELQEVTKSPPHTAHARSDAFLTKTRAHSDTTYLMDHHTPHVPQYRRQAISHDGD